MPTVLFDIGGVIVKPAPNIALVAEMLGLPASAEAEVGSAVWGHRVAYDLGLADQAYWAAVASDLNVSLPRETVAKLVAYDTSRWQHHDFEVVALIHQLVSDGVTVGILSNAPTTQARAFMAAEWTGLLRNPVFSCEIGVAKPDVAAYWAALAALAVPADQVVFFDDSVDNVAAATELGIRGELWSGVAAARRLLGY